MNENQLLSGADQDLFGHYCRLEDLRDGAGNRFDAAIHEQLELLKMNPFLGPTYPRLPLIRRLAVLEWDVGIFYRVEGTRNILLAVLHLRQSPASIRSILVSRLPQ